MATHTLKAMDDLLKEVYGPAMQEAIKDMNRQAFGSFIRIAKAEDRAIELLGELRLAEVELLHEEWREKNEFNT